MVLRRTLSGHTLTIYNSITYDICNKADCLDDCLVLLLKMTEAEQAILEEMEEAFLAEANKGGLFGGGLRGISIIGEPGIEPHLLFEN